MFGPRNQPSPPPEPVPFEKCLAKTYSREGATRPGRDVLSHCRIVGEIARALAGYYPDSLLALLFPEGWPLVAAAHDVGKISPTFLGKLLEALKIQPLVNGLPPELEKIWGGHAGVSLLTAEALNLPRYIPGILGQHHGFTPTISGRKATDDVFGGEAWQAERLRLLEALKREMAADWPQIANAEQARFLAGLTTVADWLGSGDIFDDPAEDWQPRIGEALSLAGFIQPELQPGLSFDQVFGFSERPAQRELIAQASQPGLYILEGPMGSGKTEGALYAAYQLLARKQAAGIYFALPTQLTSNKIYERFRSFLNKVLRPDSPCRALLLHANAWLLETEMGEDGRPGGEWFNQAKRGLLAPFAVGTLDQALMAAMNVKHGAVRAFGLAGKVVILDEVHTYDTYTGTILDELIKLLRRLHCTVIILSATLSRERRASLLGDKTLELSEAYPLITAHPDGGRLTERPGPIEEPTPPVLVNLSKTQEQAMDEALARAEGGQQVIWIENTVAEAQERYRVIAARADGLGLRCGLLHSRFTAFDRQNLEMDWVEKFGKNGWEKRRAKGRILVGTQVLEQSLDIDADFMVSRFAPTDMLLQRLGRLWRHKKTPRPPAAAAEAWVLAPELEPARANPLAAFGSTAYVYSPYVLCRSLEVWFGRASAPLRLPGEIRPLIEATYQNRPEADSMKKWLDELENGNGSKRPKQIGRQALRQLANITLAQNGKTPSESQAQTRYSDQESADVLLLREMRLPGQKGSCLTLLSGEQVTLPRWPGGLTKAGWRQLSVQLFQQVVKVPVKDAPEAMPIDTLSEYGLQRCFYLGKIKCEGKNLAILRVAVVDEAGYLRLPDGSPAQAKCALKYRQDLGYMLEKAD